MKRLFLLSSVVLLFTSVSAVAQIEQNSWDNTPTELINEIYKTVSTNKGETADWEKVRSMFVNEAVVILRTSMEHTKQFTVDGYIQDFKDFYEYPAVKANGFEEKILKMKSMVYKDMAYIATVYSAHIVGSKNPPQIGIDFWLLRKKDGRWKIFAISNEVIPAGQELPDEPEWKF